MSAVFLSYKREDETRVTRLALALRSSGLDVWWDRALAGGEHWRQRIEAELDSARCVVVVWTKSSVSIEGTFVRDEADRGAARHILIPVLFDRVPLPLGFGETQAIDLTHWRGSKSDPFFEDLVVAIRAKVEGILPPPPKGPIRRAIRRATAGGLVAGLTAALSALAASTMNLQPKLCGLSVGQPWLSDACGAVGTGGKPTRDERIAWESRKRGDCEALREHLRRFPAGALRVEAQTLLSTPTKKSEVSTSRKEHELKLFVGNDDALPSRNEDLARASALERGKRGAASLCKGFEASGIFTLRATDAEPATWDCRRARNGWTCGFQGKAVCSLDAPKELEYERCDGPRTLGGL